MPVTDIQKDIDSRTITITAEFAAPVQRVWQVYADPRQLEKIWGPPTYPATVVDHDLRPGGRVTYYMTSPEGEKFGGFWNVMEVDEPNSFTFNDGFADAETFEAVESMPVSTCVSTFTEHNGGTKATYVTTYETAEALQQVIDMGVEEGSRESINQIDGLVAA